MISQKIYFLEKEKTITHFSESKRILYLEHLFAVGSDFSDGTDFLIFSFCRIILQKLRCIPKLPDFCLCNSCYLGPDYLLLATPPGARLLTLGHSTWGQTTHSRPLYLGPDYSLLATLPGARQRGHPPAQQLQNQQRRKQVLRSSLPIPADFYILEIYFYII